ncbi:hypothetical protein KIAC18_003978 [Sporomusa sphaeroides]|uniref:hypothetical protein n=1 Tax=Sporomusa sphaeroides TaxID=47679 RepID=UPI003DA0CD5E
MEIKQLPKTPTLPPDTADGGKSLVRALWDHIIQSNETINKLIKAVKQAADYPEITPEGIGAATVKHAENHHAGGEDQLTPAAIGAAPAEGSEHYASKQELTNFITTWVSSDGNWYRKYADGWVEQGGKCANNNANPITFPVPLITKPVCLTGNFEWNTSFNGYGVSFGTVTQTGFYLTTYAGNNFPFYWQAKGRWK